MKLFRYRRPSLNTVLGITAAKRRIRRSLGISQLEGYTKPSRIRQTSHERYGFMPDNDIEFIEQDGSIGIRRVDTGPGDRVDEFLDRLTASGAGVLSTGAVMELSRGYSSDA